MLLPSPGQDVQRFECLRITDIETHLWSSIPGKSIGAWDGEDATAVAELVASLPAGEVYRCFTPRYGIRAHAADAVLFEIAFCFRCHGALILRPGQRELVAFGADSPPAQELLGRFKALPGDSQE
jgi:hypothetical protein